MKDRDRLIAAERSSAAEAAKVLLAALGWGSGGLASAALEIVSQRDELLAALKQLIEDFHAHAKQCSPGYTFEARRVVARITESGRGK